MTNDKSCKDCLYLKDTRHQCLCILHNWWPNADNDICPDFSTIINEDLTLEKHAKWNTLFTTLIILAEAFQLNKTIENIENDLEETNHEPSRSNLN